MTVMTRESVSLSHNNAGCLPELDLGHIGITTDGEHDWQRTFGRSGLTKSVANEFHVCIRLFSEAHSKKDVDGET
jgi:hypothetical protein